MELQLGLALPNNDPLVLQLGPLPWLHSINTNNNSKRRFESAFVEEENNNIINEEEVPRTLPLFLWDNKKPDEEDDTNDKGVDNSSFVSNKNRNKEGGEGFVGWPPINLHRRKLINYLQSYQNHGLFADYCVQGRQLLPAVANPNSKYVKVKVEGMAIARKIDLSIHHSFSTLKQTLFRMFGICQENFGCYELIYQDAEGDWQLAEDHITWRNFTGSAQRLKLKKKSG